MNFLTYIFVYLFQYISRLVTGRCELSRIIADCPKGAPRTVRIENSLRNSKNKSIQNGLLLGKCTDAKSHVQLVISAKRIDLKDQPNFPTDYLYCISQINSYRELINTLDALKCTAFNSDDHYHFELLSRLWICLDSQNELSSHNGEKWTLLGFQTENPETDFRGMGILSLENLVYFAESHTKLARSMLSASHHPNKWYPFAVTGIHLTKLSYNLVLKGYLKYQFYNMSSSASIQDFNEFYCRCYHFSFRNFPTFICLFI
ncbi:unnamed protein product [Schistosoma bovis]|nr:unnamed protein product [Schistosoma bovis]